MRWGKVKSKIGIENKILMSPITYNLGLTFLLIFNLFTQFLNLLGVFMKKLWVTSFLFTSSFFCSYPQIDTADYFPLKTGNYWEYWGTENWTANWIKMTLESIGDTVMPNGETYQRIRQTFYEDSTNPDIYLFYLRYYDKRVYYYDSDTSCISSEYIYYDFEKPDSSIWPICNTNFSNYRGIESTFLFFSPTLNLQYEGKIFNWIEVTGNDTIWAPMGSPYVDKIGKGIGIIDRFIWDFSDFYIYGAIINNQVYGTITSVEDKGKMVDEYSLSQNYPNPFNPSTTINYKLSKAGFVTLKIYDILGKEVATFVNEEKPAGAYNVEFRIKFWNLLLQASGWGLC